jgi:hypothetical protein
MLDIFKNFSLSSLTVGSMTVIAIAIITTSIALVLFGIMAWKMRGRGFSKPLTFIILGLIFAILIHSGAGLLTAYDVCGRRELLNVMGISLLIGSIFFILAGWYGIKSIKSIKSIKKNKK